MALPSVPDEVSIPTTVQATIYAYNSFKSQTDESPFVTASGVTVFDGALACPSKYPFGTKVSIEGKNYTCVDRMAQRYRNGNNFDIWMESYEEAIKWGVKDSIVLVYP